MAKDITTGFRPEPSVQYPLSVLSLHIVPGGGLGTSIAWPKAKELKRVAEPLITLAKKDSVANRRLAFARMGSKAAVGKLFGELGPRYQDRPGGYTRILKCGFRPGDAAPMAFLELVDRPLPDNDDDFDDLEDDDET